MYLTTVRAHLRVFGRLGPLRPHVQLLVVFVERWIKQELVNHPAMDVHARELSGCWFLSQNYHYQKFIIGKLKNSKKWQHLGVAQLVY